MSWLVVIFAYFNAYFVSLKLISLKVILLPLWKNSSKTQELVDLNVKTCHININIKWLHSSPTPSSALPRLHFQLHKWVLLQEYGERSSKSQRAKIWTWSARGCKQVITFKSTSSWVLLLFYYWPPNPRMKTKICLNTKAQRNLSRGSKHATSVCTAIP